MDDFQKFLARQVPEAIRSDAPPPGWEGSPDGWEEALTIARENWRARLAEEFVHKIGQGWTSHELANGQPDPGTETILPGGAPRRPLPGPRSDLRERATRLMRAIGGRPGLIDDVLASTVEGLYRGLPGSDDFVGVEDQLAAAEHQFAAHQMTRNAERAAVVADSVEVNFQYGLRAVGRHFDAGRQTITKAELASLEAWRQNMEAQASGRGWAAPVGFENRVWPPYRVVSDNAPTSRVGDDSHAA